MDKKIRALNQGLKTLILLELIGASIISYFSKKVKEKRNLMEERRLKIRFGKSGNGGVNPTMSIPKKWVDSMGIMKENNEVIVVFDEETKTIKITKC